MEAEEKYKELEEWGWELIFRMMMEGSYLLPR